MIPPELHLPMAKETCVAYVSVHPRLRKSMGSRCVDPSRRRDFKHFLGIVEKCSRLGTDPVGYVTGVMTEHLTMDPSNVVARDLDDENRIRHYMQASAGAGIMPEEQWVNMTTLFRRSIERHYGSVKVVREDEERELKDFRKAYSAWFGVLYLDPASESLFEFHGDAAARELCGSEKLREFAMKVRPGVYVSFMKHRGLHHVLLSDGVTA